MYKKFSGNLPLIIFLIATTSLALLSQSSIPLQLGRIDESHMWLIHLSFELTSIFVYISIVTVLFQRIDHSAKHNKNHLLFGFTLIAGLDYLHALSYQGMPTLVTPSETGKALFFWLIARVSETIVLIIIAARSKFDGKKEVWVLLALLLSAFFAYLGLFKLEIFPKTFIAGKGLTPFKANIEYALFISNMILALYFYCSYNKSYYLQHLYFSGAAFCIALCSFTLTNYSEPTDFNLLIGHFFKILAAMCMYEALVWTELKRPIKQIIKANEKIKSKEAELESILKSIPIGIIKLNKANQVIYSNHFFERYSNKLYNLKKNHSLTETLPKDTRSLFEAELMKLNKHQDISFNLCVSNLHNQNIHHEVSLIRQPNEELLCVVVDTTDRENAVQRQIAAYQETQQLKKAFDEHAIVAFTDNKGIITAVNKKFCEISKYKEGELIGKSHRIINSNHHPRSFFNNMWKTIASGEIWNGEIKNKAKDGTFYWVQTTIVPFLDERGCPKQYIAIRADITQRKLAENKAARLAYYDELTALPNRRYLKEKLDEHFKGPDKKIKAMLMCDLDNFKEINDVLGHIGGDLLLTQVAERFTKIFPEPNFVSRFGGDEFILLMPEPSLALESNELSSIEFGCLAKSIFEEPFELFHQHYHVSASIGIAEYSAEIKSSTELLKCADIAMYEAKALGKDNIALFSSDMLHKIVERNELISQLILAQSRNELVVVYQPIYDKSKKVVSCEALLRWYSETLGIVSPDTFIPLAEQTGQILEIGDFVIDTACKQLSEWSLEPHTSNISIAVNISARQFSEPEFVQKIKVTIDRHKIDPKLLKLEVTESSLQTNIQSTIKAMNKLKALGIMFSLDDFGTGYSSLSYLSRLPIDILKIDRSFIDAMLTSEEDTEIVVTILSLASTLGIEVVAEGVETLEQMNFLIERNCEYYQGYYLSKPKSKDLLLEALRSNILISR